MSLQEKIPTSFTPHIRPDSGWRKPTSTGDHIAQLLSDALVQIEIWWRTARQRRALSRLDDRMLKDIGLTREQAEREAMRPFWDGAPERRRSKASWPGR